MNVDQVQEKSPESRVNSGSVPPSAYAKLKVEIWRPSETLVRLRHYGNVEKMPYNCKGQGLAGDDMPSML